MLYRASLARLANLRRIAPRYRLAIRHSRATARIDVPQRRSFRCHCADHVSNARSAACALALPRGGAELAQAVFDSGCPTGCGRFYPTSDAALRLPEHLAAVAPCRRLRVRTQAFCRRWHDNLVQELAGLRASGAPTGAPLGYCFWSPSAIENFASARGFELPPGPVVLIGGSTERCWRESAPPNWRSGHKHDAETPLEWSLRFLERGAASGGS
jgi:hypothetical protein